VSGRIPTGGKQIFSSGKGADSKGKWKDLIF